MTEAPGTEVSERLTRWLTEAGVSFQRFEHEPVYTSDEAARVRGTRVEEGAKALVVRAEDRYVHVVVPGHRKLDNSLLRTILGTRKLRFATTDELRSLTGCAPGAVPPFGNLFGLPVFVDEELARRDRVAFNAGSNSVSIAMRADDLVRLSGATICRLTRDESQNVTQ
jgi:Ala-tRNA(Pro) deacylase